MIDSDKGDLIVCCFSFNLKPSKFYIVKLLNAKWKVVSARNSGWKKENLYKSQFAWRCLNLKLVILPYTGVSWREDVLRFNRRESVNNFVQKD